MKYYQLTKQNCLVWELHVDTLLLINWFDFKIYLQTWKIIGFREMGPKSVSNQDLYIMAV